MNGFHITECIRKTKQRIPLTDEEIRALVAGVTAEPPIPDYQLSAWLMAVCLCGLTDRETAVLTTAMRDSGQIMHWELDGAVADKHSTGGVGDKTTLILAPIAAACGIYMPKMSGRGLGHTGGTIDKLESIPGLTTALDRERFLSVVKRAGFAVGMQTGNLAPADKKLYALRDVTETVDSIPLICASIMSKKLATGADYILLDVKVGSGAFMKTESDARELARLMTEAAESDGKRCAAVLSDMDKPLGMCIGNAIEVREAIEVLHGDTRSALGEFCLDTAAELLHLTGQGTLADCRLRAEQAVHSGEALHRLALMIEGQGGDSHVTEDVSLLPRARCSRTLRAEYTGILTRMDAETVGRASVLLGAGRMQKSDPVDPAAGIELHATRGDTVWRGDALITLYAADEAKLDEAERAVRSCIELTPPVAGGHSPS